MKYTPDFSSRFRILKGGKISLVVSALIAGSTMSFAAPTGGTVTTGTATINQNGSVTTINQSTNKASINWSSFSITPSETVNFVQPSAQSVTLNRVIGTSQSLIQGVMNANGQVFLLNPNGVLFSKDAQLNVGGIVASTLNITDANFQAGNYLFEGNSQNSIINMGTITASNGGYVAMMGKTVANEGTIVATMGNVQMASGEKISLNLNGNSLVKLTIDQGTLNALVENKGLIQADGGQVYLTTQALNTILDGMVNNTGVIEAQTIDDLKGEVILYAHGGTANVSGTINASGGFVETSGKNLSVADGTIIKAKKWLLDPENVTIESAGGAVGTSSVSASAIETALATADIEIQADNDITVNEAIDIHTVNDGGYTVGGLTLIAGNDININEVITVGPEGYLALNHGWNGTEWDGSNEATVYGNGGKITFGMNTEKTDFVGKVAFAPNENTPGFENSAIYINEVEQTLIRSVAELQAMQQTSNGVIGNSTDRANALKGNYVLAADIDMDGESWTPIGKYKYSNNGTDYSLDFKGNFNGLGHTISNLTMSGDFTYNGDGQASGLFGNIATTYDVATQTKYAANISGIRLLNASVTNTYTHDNSTWNNIYTAQTAALVGAARDNSSLISGDPTIPSLTPVVHNNIVTGSTVQSTGDGSDVAAIVGGTSGALISDNAVTNTTVRSLSGYDVGGIVGTARNSTINDSYVADSTIKSAYGEVGGIVGTMSASTVDGAMVKNSLIQADGTLQGSYGAGGIVGYAEEGSHIIDSASEGNTIAAMQDAGGIVGYLDDSSYDLEGDEPSTVTNSFYKLDTTKIGTNLATPASNSTGVITYGGVYATQYDAWLAANKVMTVAGLSADANGYYLINNSTDFKKMLAFAYDPANNFKLASSFTLDAGLYMPVLKGILDGNSKTITGLSVTQGYNANIGLVGRLLGGTVKNLTLSGVTLDGYAYVGGIAGYAAGRDYTLYDGSAQYDNFPTISNVTVTNFNYDHTQDFTVQTQHIGTYVENIGAIAGYAEGAALSNLSATGTIDIDLTANSNGYDNAGLSNIGGLFGTLSNSTLNTANSAVAINAILTSEIDPTNNGNSLDAYDIGGLAGSADSSIIQNATTSGAVEITMIHKDTESGWASLESVGGMFGSIYDSYVKTATSTNPITLNTNGSIYSIGGIAGSSRSSLFDTVTTSGLMSTDGATVGDTKIFSNDQEYIGGMIGESDSDVIKTAASTRDITLKSDTTDSYIYGIGGLVGYAEYSNISDSSYTGTIDASTATYGENIGGLVGYNSGEIDYHEQAYFGKTISATTTPENLAQREADEAALLAAYNARADVIALKALGYTVDNSSSGNDGEPYHVNFSLVSPNNTEWGVIKNATATVNIKAQNAENVGGLVGSMDSEDGGQIINSSVTALNGTSKVDGYSNVGGLVGKNSYGNIVESDATINVKANSTSEANVGGLVGYIEGDERSEDISVNYGDYADDYIWSYATEQEALDALESVKAQYIADRLAENPGFEKDYVEAQVVNYNFIPNTIQIDLELVKYIPIGAISNSYASGTVTSAGTNAGGLVGYMSESTITESHATGTVSGTENVGGLVGQLYNSSMEESYATGKVTGTGVGAGGLVGYAESSEIIDSYHTTGKVTGTDNHDGFIGGLVGQLIDSSIENSYATSEVVGEVSVGGLVGFADSSEIIDSYATGKVTATGVVQDASELGFNANELISVAGGLIGSAYGSTIENSYATGEVVGKAVLGGFAGSLFGSDVTLSYATGKVTGTNGLGGFVGVSMMSNTSQSYATGVVTGTAATGVEGVTAGNMVGGFVGLSMGDTIEESYTTSNVTGVTNVGGFAGKVNNGSAISDTYAQGSVTASGNNVGSFAGSLDGSTVENSYASGKITQTGSNQMSVKGFVGNHDGDIINSFYDKTVNAGLTDNGSNVGKTTTELKTLATYTSEIEPSWDISGENGHYPILGFQTEGAESTWVMAEGEMPVDPTPSEPTPEVLTPEQEQTQTQVNDIVTTIVNSTTVTPPVQIAVSPAAPQQQVQTQAQNTALLQTILPQETTSGGTFNLVGATDGATPVQTVSMDQLQSAALTQGVGEIRVPLGNGSVVDLINGGVTLPAGVSQEFYVVASNDKGSSTGSSSNNKNKKKK